ncbi:MAG: hypothetical protein KJ970_00315 [Candidatus Eisenbacteria bacterium]|uniref:Uncharacterized protein n=1 Tax=Eiseniibacteriota bacterium TaxID=2212470 RepID=A0A948RQU4_UNCEI|nr:hypothetical protein [Candidatus Eisenbacteria bacterium]MBU1947653.1 hypothetical protein [Candidatus Eisenbacteria bacterium]MBU2689343.1 hypothetical protein [Candidatus Eisenbacteria bacterium]
MPLVFSALPLAADDEPIISIGFHENTQILPPPNDEFCPRDTLLQNDDGQFENAYMWRLEGVVPPDYSCFAERYDATYVCGIQLYLTSDGSQFDNQTLDLYLWQSVLEDGPNPIPGNIICSRIMIEPGPIATWPEISVHQLSMNCCVDGAHFAGYWGNWPFNQQEGWYVAADEASDTTNARSATKVFPGLGYGSGWVPINEIFPNCKNLGIREMARDRCSPWPTKTTSWGKIKSLY